MISTLILAASVAGQACYVQQRAAVRTYAAPVAYQQQYAVNTYSQQAYTTAYVPVQYYDVVGSVQRGVNLRQAALQSQAALAARVDKLALSIDGLTAIIAKETTVAVTEPTPVAPGKPSPEVPGKPSPQGPTVIPQGPPVTPKVNPDDGSVPPPPTPVVPGQPVPDAVAQVLNNRCAKCHGAIAADTMGGGFALFAEDGSIRNGIPSPKLVDLLYRVSVGNMPKKASPLPPEELAAIRAWVTQDPKVSAFFGGPR